MKIENVKIDDLRHAEYNPRLLTEQDAIQIQKSIQEFGFLQPLIVNSFGDRKGVIVGGNQRFEILKRMGHKEIPCIFVSIPDLKRERELNLRLNRNTGKWDWDELANFDVNELITAGFNQNELEFHFGEWNPDFTAMKKHKETDSGILATIKISCPQHMADEVREKLKNAFDGVADVVIS